MIATMGKGEKKCLYAGYDNTPDSQFIDIEHLEERRMAVGMPTWEMRKNRIELIKRQHEQ
jgi:hypothetical protein